jgi:molybdopterin converting factor small subunit
VAHVTFVTSICDEFTQGREQIDVSAETVFSLVSALDRDFPGLGKFLETRASIAVDGELIQNWTQKLTEDSDVLLFPRLAGGLGEPWEAVSRQSFS